MGLADDLERIAAVAARHASDGDVVTAVLPAEPVPGVRTYLCAFNATGGARSWLALNEGGALVTHRRDLRDTVAITALCEIAGETAGGGELEQLHAQLAALRVAEAPAGIEEAEEAVVALERVIGAPPQLASPARLDAIGAAARRLEFALDPDVPSPFAAALQAAQGAIDELMREVEASYRIPLD